MAVNCKMYFILDGRKEFASELVMFVIINTRSKNISYFLIEVSLTGTNITNSLQEFIKVPSTIATLFESFIVKCKTFDNIITQSSSCPCGWCFCGMRCGTITGIKTSKCLRD